MLQLQNMYRHALASVICEQKINLRLLTVITLLLCEKAGASSLGIVWISRLSS